MDLTEILNKVDWREVYKIQYGGRDEIGKGRISKGQIILEWSNDNGWGHVTASGKATMVYRDGSLAFKPNEKAKELLYKYGYYESESNTIL